AVLPYERGSILDADGRVLVEDRAVYELQLTYRSFRRGHPLGIVAHARAALERRAVPLDEALADLTAWAAHLVRLSPADLHGFGRGKALEVGELRLGSVEQPFRAQRQARASDLRYYARALLRPDDREQRALIKLERNDDEARSYLELVAGLRGVSPDAMLAERRQAWTESIEGLALLARRIAESATRSDAGFDGWLEGDPLDLLVADLEAWRCSVEDAAAARLFRETLGFTIGRLDPDLARAHLDLDWLAEQLRWRPERVDAWCRSEREDFVAGWRDGFAVPRLMAELRVRPERGASAERALDLLVSTFAEPEVFAAALDGVERDWRRPGRLEGVDDLRRVLDVPANAPRLGPDRPALVIHGADFRAGFAAAQPDWSDLARLIDADDARRAADALLEVDPTLRGVGPSDLGRLWRESAPRGIVRFRARSEVIASALLRSLDRGLQGYLSREFELLRAASGGERLRPAEEYLDRLAERSRHLLRDYGSRAAALLEAPSYEVVYLLTRDPERFPGLSARARRERRHVRRSDERTLPAAELLGTVSAEAITSLRARKRTIPRGADSRHRRPKSEG
ncbi:MAG: hypothetical protein AAFZ65_20070, partial [Planctomycetota bacterium]